jgi:hypothetical protein
MAKFRCHDGMTIYDVALQLYGDTSKVLKLMRDNNINIFTNLTGLYLDYEVTNTSLPSHLLSNGININTGGGSSTTVNTSGFDSGFSFFGFH